MSFNPAVVCSPILAIGCGLGVWATGALLVFITGEKAKHVFFSSLLFIGAILIGLGVVLSYNRWGFTLNLLPYCYFGLVPLIVRLDTLVCFFLGMVALIVCPLAIFSPAYLSRYKDSIHPGIYWHCVFMFMLTLCLTFLTTNAICFLIFWETMSLAAMTLIASDHVRQRARHAALIYLGVTTISTVFIFGSFLWYYHLFHSWNFSDWHAAGSLTFPALLLFFGIVAKAGIWPFHIWMSYAQAEAPGPVAALMSTVMKTVGIYTIIRLLIVDNDHGLVIAYLALGLGSVSMIWGALFALLEHDLKRLLSYSSVENMGVVLIALGLCLMGRCSGHWDLAYLALAAALFHTVNHSLAKAGLFVGAGNIEAVTHIRDLTFLGGLAKRMPWTAGCFLINSLAIVALPPFNGFASKWMVYQSLFKLAMSDAQVFDRGLAISIIGLLGLVSALSLACYTKAIGICFLGRPRSEPINQATELSRGSIIVQLFFAGTCLVGGLTVPCLLPILWPACYEVLPKISHAENLFSLPLGTITFIGVSIAACAVISLINFAKRPQASLKKYVTWDCGYGNLSARAEETGTSFSESIARIFAPILRYRMITEIQGKDRRHFPEVIKFESVTSPLFEGLLYKPSKKVLLVLSRGIGGLQTGSIHLYLLYVFVTLLILVGIGIRL